MKRFVRFVGILLVLSVVLVAPVSATGNAAPRASALIVSHNAFLEKLTSTTFDIWYDVTAREVMDKLGVSSIFVDKSADGENWTQVASYSSAHYGALIASNTGSHAGHFVYRGATPGYKYQVCLTFYAKNDNITSEVFRYTRVLQM